MKYKVIGLGAGGHAKVIIDALYLLDQVDIIALTDPNTILHGCKILGVTIVGGDDQVALLVQQGATKFFIGAGSVSDSTIRQKLFAWGKEQGLEPIKVIHPNAIVASSAFLGNGVMIFAGAIVNAGTKIGDNVIINTGAIIEHDCVIEDHAHIATGARLTGAVIVGKGSHIGAGATIRQGIKIGAQSIVGAGAVVVKDVQDGETVVGVPAKILIKNNLD